METFGLLGRTLGHSWSPEIHEYLGSTPYRLCECEPDALHAFLATTSLSAMNVTIPYKKAVLSHCVSLSPTAKQLGSVNALVKKADGWHGYNTDYDGFSFMVQISGICIEGKKVLVLGSGGASVTVVAVLQDLGAKSVIVISRSGENNYENLHLHKDAQIIVNTTPVGMYPHNGESPVDLNAFPACQGVLDIVYNPQKTELLLDAERLGIPCMGGLSMLVAQAKHASELFRDVTIPMEKVTEITEILRKKMQNIVLIGMPGCGKSTVAQALSEKLSLEVVDADAEIVKSAGMSIPEIFETHGEAGFRKLESQVLAELGKGTGKIIATGGGCVTREENYNALHQNGLVIWLQRDIDTLPTDGRPLSQAGKLQEMYRIRKPLYDHFADAAVDNNGTLEETLTAILEVLQ